MNNLFRNGPVLEMLDAFGRVVNRFGIDFFLVGALARDIRLSGNPALAPKRATRDVDIAIMLASEEQFYQVKDALLATGDFTAHERNAIKLFYKHSIEVDLLPFGDIEGLTREARIERPQPFVMDVPGFKEVLPDVGLLSIEGIDIRVCSLEGIVLLKIIANGDNPLRTKDLTDIEHIVHVYFDLNDEMIFQDFADVFDLYNTENNDFEKLVSARVIGRRIARLLTGSSSLKSRVLELLSNKSSGGYWTEIAAGITDD